MIFTVCLVTILRHMYKILALLVHKSIIYRVIKHVQWIKWMFFVEFGCYVNFTIWQISLAWKLKCECVTYQWNGKSCRLHGGIKTIRLYTLINRNTNLSDPWLRTLEITLFRHIVKLLTTIYKIYQLISEYNYNTFLSKIDKSKLSEFSNFQKWNLFFFLRKNVTINFEHCPIFSRAVKLILIF